MPILPTPATKRDTLELSQGAGQQHQIAYPAHTNNKDECLRALLWWRGSNTTSPMLLTPTTMRDALERSYGGRAATSPCISCPHLQQGGMPYSTFTEWGSNTTSSILPTLATRRNTLEPNYGDGAATPHCPSCSNQRQGWTPESIVYAAESNTTLPILPTLAT